jgi:type IV pilus assembly protein PilW
MVALIQEDTASPNKLLYPDEKWKDYRTPTTCSLLQVTCPVSAAGCPATLPVPTGQYNKGGGTGLIPFDAGTRLYNLGQLNLVTYRISGNNLLADISKFGVIPDGGTGTAVANRTDYSPLASNIVNMQVQYGVDASNSGVANCKSSGGPSLDTTDADAVVDAWVDATGQWANNGGTSPSLFDLRRIRAVRIGLVARSGVKASGKTDDPCNAIAPVISWDSGPDMAPVLSADADWQCYRYKVFQTTIPVRNALWSSTMSPASTSSCGLRG